MTRISDPLPDLSLLGRELERCGWKPARSGRLEGELFFQTGRGGVRAPTLLFQTEREEKLLVVDLGDFELAGRNELFPRFLDFPLETRMALGAAAVVAEAVWLLMLSRGRMELFRLPGENLEYGVETARDYEDELLPALAAKARMRGESLSAVPNFMDQAKTLRGWLAHWTRRLAEQLEAEPGECERWLWKLLLMLQAARTTGRSEILGAWGLACEKLGDVWTLSYTSVSTHEDFARAFDAFDHTFSTRLFPQPAETHKQWLAKLEETSLAEQLRAEMLMQPQLRFEAETVAWMHAKIEREQEGWRREVKGLPPVRRRIAGEGWAVIQPLTCDAERFGLLAMLRDVERLAEHWSAQDAFARSERFDPEQRIYTQPDLFFGTPRGVGPSNQLDDGINFLFDASLRVRGVKPEERFGVGAALLLKALDLVKRFDWPFFGIDTLDRVWTE